MKGDLKLKKECRACEGPRSPIHLERILNGTVIDYGDQESMERMKQ
jgi:hypothetical protein